MNNQFEEYVRSGAFTLNLSERMIKVLLFLTGNSKQDERLNLAPYQALERRGLVKHKKNNGYKPTKEGYLVSELLILAGYIYK